MEFEYKVDPECPPGKMYLLPVPPSEHTYGPWEGFWWGSTWAERSFCTCHTEFGERMEKRRLPET